MYALADDEDKFVFNEDNVIVTLDVEGIPRGTLVSATVTPNATGSGSSSYGSSSASTSRRPFSSSKKATFSLKVTKATKSVCGNGKPVLVPSKSVYVEITPATANVPEITAMIQEKCGESYGLHGADGLPIMDCAGTRGQKVI